MNDPIINDRVMLVFLIGCSLLAFVSWVLDPA
jgi:hypothetical protein